MKFDWTNFTEVDFTDYCAKTENDILIATDDYVGCVRVGNLCFDLLIRFDDNNKSYLSYDLYVGGVDSGYGYSSRNDKTEEYPYDYADGGMFEDRMIWMTYEEFQKYAEYEFEKYINTHNYSEASLVDKANEPLNIW